MYEKIKLWMKALAEPKICRTSDGFNDHAASNFIRIVKIPLAGSKIGAGSSFFYEADDSEEADFYPFREDFILKLGIPISSLKTVAKYASFSSVQILEMFSSVFWRIFH